MRWQLRGLWRNQDFVRLWLGRTVSNVGNGITGLALPLTAVLILSATPLQMGILSALSGFSTLLLGLFAGTWVDRLRCRPIMIATDIGRALLLISIPLAMLAGVLRIEQLYCVAALLGILTVFFNVADASFLPALLSQEELVEGNSKLAMADSLAEIGGPSLAGPLVQLWGAPLAIIVDVLTFLGSAWCLFRIAKKEVKPLVSATSSSFWRESFEGLHFVWGNSLLRVLALSAGLFNCSGMFVGTLYALYVVNDLHVAPGWLGLIVATGGLSSLLGAWIAERVISQFGIGPTIGGALLLYGLIGLLIPLAQGPMLIVILLLFMSQLLGDIAVMLHLIAELSLRQSLIPQHLLGRANACIQQLTQGVMPLGALLAGVLAEGLGIRFTLLLGLLGIILAGLCLLLSPVRKVRTLE
ncbi:MFS transporter [Ktedonosporobacter rubrisoli]|uniref:MFS transporter n=1 Tax=Ktedonosporobacter rubrisoli TaxID=2509675 RepID=A0A4V0YYN8_KTERU|nr:MFS transporter [Ktedonosporobacter rubrisoli]QBD76871.1 MFS transporter [Ktedonosporobacter rubrisoli]